MDYTAPPGVFDILPDEPKDVWRRSHLWLYVESIMRKTAREFGFQEIRTPIFEKTDLFQRSVGETSDIVSKEMYTFEDRGGRMLSLRPEGTAPAIRAFIENKLASRGPVHKLFYIAPMFRYERQQAGRYRQHHQFGAEAIGNSAPEQDVEVIDLLYTLYARLGLKNLRVMISSLGSKTSRDRYRDALRDYLKDHTSHLSEDSKKRLEANPLRILDSKDAADQQLLINAPSILDFLEPECKEHFESVLNLLKILNIPFEINPRLVRGLDYYNRTVFEVVSESLGSQNSIGGGGRYDSLISELGGPELPALGFGTGIERIIQSMINQEVSLPAPYQPTLFLIPLGDNAKLACFKILHDLRMENIQAQMDFTGKKLGKVMQHANQIGAEFVVVIGDKEIETGNVELKNMASGESLSAPIKSLSKILRFQTSEEDFIHLWNEISAPFDHPLEAKFFLDKIKKSIDSTTKITKDLQAAVQQIETLI